MNVREKDRAFLVTSSSVEELQIVRSDGSFLSVARGRKYIDFITGWNVGNFGWGCREIKAAIRRFKSPEYIYPWAGLLLTGDDGALMRFPALNMDSKVAREGLNILEQCL